MNESLILRGVSVAPVRKPLSSLSTAAGPAFAASAPEATQALAERSTAETEADKGYAEGLRRGLADAQARLEREIEQRAKSIQARLEQSERRRQDEHGQRLAGLNALHDRFQSALANRLEAVEQEAIGLAFEALCRVCGPQGPEGRASSRGDLIADVVRQGVCQLRGQAWLALRVHPLVHEALMASEAGRVLLEEQAGLRVQVDPSLEPMGVVVEGDQGGIDVGMDTQLARLKDLWSQPAAGDAPSPGRPA